MAKKVGVSQEEKALPYYRFFEQLLAPIPAEKLAILENGPSEISAVPFEEKEEFAAPCRACGVSLISVVTPASRGRIGMIAREAEGFLYAAAGRGEEGCLSSVIEEAKQVCPVPCAVWADIAAPAGAKALCGAEDGVAADTQPVRIAANYGKEAPAHIGKFVKEIKAALR